MAGISSMGTGLRNRRTARLLLASAAVLIAGALLPAAASADISVTWPDITNNYAASQCTPITYNDPVADTWDFEAHQSAPYSPFGLGYSASYVKFAVWSRTQARWVGVDQNWRYIPQNVFGLRNVGLAWPYGQGSFSVSVQFAHNGVASVWYHNVGRMTWSGGLCFNY